MEITTPVIIELKNKNISIELSNFGASIYRIRFNNEDMVVTPINKNDFIKKNIYFGKSHAELSHLYSSITSDMWNAAKKMGHNFLRECSKDDLEKYKPQLTEGEYNRALHFFNENERVEKGQNCLKNGDFAGYFACVRASEESSRTLLKNAMVDDVYEGSLGYRMGILGCSTAEMKTSLNQ